MRIFKSPLLYIGFALLLVYAHADFLWQGEMHGWPVWLDLTARAPRWPWYIDIVPRDLWHLIQFAKNTALWLGSPLVFYAWASVGRYVYGDDNRVRVYSAMWGLGVVAAAYALARAIGFTLPLALLP